MNLRLLILLKNIDGGTGTYLKGLMDLKKEIRGLRVSVLVLERPNYRNNYSKDYIFYKKTHSNTKKYGLGSIVDLVSEIFWFKKYTLYLKPDVVISSNFYSIFVTQTAKTVFGMQYKTISLLQNNFDMVSKFKLTRYLLLPFKIVLSFYLNKSDSVVSVSEDLGKDLYKSLNLQNVPLVIPAMLSKTDYKLQKIGLKSAKKIIITTARLDQQKDHATLFLAYKELLRVRSDCLLWVVGDGPLKGDLVRLAKKINIYSKVVFFGWIQDPSYLIKKSHLFVLSSKWEGFPLSLLEAMNLGIPVISTDCKYGPREILGNNKYGLIFQQGDYLTLAKEINLILSNDNKYKHYSIAARNRSLDYSKDKMLPRYKNLVLKLAA